MHASGLLQFLIRLIDQAARRQFRLKLDLFAQHWLALMVATPTDRIAIDFQLNREPHMITVATPAFSYRLIVKQIVRDRCTNVARAAPWALHWQHGAYAPNNMNFGKWLLVDIPPEKLFKLEADCRALEENPKAGHIAAMLLRQTYRQQELLQSAVHEIARLELMIMNQKTSS